MIKLFRSIQPIILLFLILYLVLCSTMYFLYPIEVQFNHVLLTEDTYLGKLLKSIPAIILQLLGIAFVIFQAIKLNQSTNRFRLFEVSNFLPALALATTYLFFAQWISFNETMLANVFLLLAILRILNMFGRENALIDSFDIGLLVGIASLFYAPALWFIPACFLGIHSVKRLKLKEVVLLLLGFLIPLFLVFVPLFWFDESFEFFSTHFQFGVSDQFQELFSNTEFVIKLVMIILITSVSGLIILSRRMQKVNRFRRSFQVVLVFLIFAIISLFFVPHLNIAHWSILALPVAIYVAFLFNEFSNSWKAEVIHLVMLFVILFFQFQRFV